MYGSKPLLPPSDTDFLSHDLKMKTILLFYKR